MVCEILQQTSGFEFHASSDGSEDELVSPVSADCSIHSRSIPMARSFTGSLLLDKSRSSPSNEPSPEVSPTKSRPTSLRSQSQASDDLPTTMNQLRMQPLDQNQESPTHSEHDPDEVKTDNEALAYSVHSEGSLNLTASLYLLPDELVCVGLDVSMEKIWREKLVKALFYSVDVLDENQREQRNDRRSTSVDPGTSGSRSRQRRSRTYQTLAEESRSPTFVPTGTAPTALQDAPVPFFSFTATSDNASLVLDVRLLRTLFVEDEQHMLFTVGGEGVSGQFQGELGTMDARKGRAAQNVSGSEARGRTGRFSATEDWTPDEANIESGRHIMKCLQLVRVPIPSALASTSLKGRIRTCHRSDWTRRG